MKILSPINPKYGTISIISSSRRHLRWSWFRSACRRTKSWSDWQTWKITLMVWPPRLTSLTSMLGLESSTLRLILITWWPIPLLSFSRVSDSTSLRWTSLAQFPSLTLTTKHYHTLNGYNWVSLLKHWIVLLRLSLIWQNSTKSQKIIYNLLKLREQKAHLNHLARFMSRTS